MTWLLILLSFTVLAEQPEFDEGIVSLSLGDTFFRKITVDPGAAYAVFVHGASLNCSMGSYNNYMRKLASNGINVICFDVYGAGRSDSIPSSKVINLEHLVQQISDFTGTYEEVKNKKNYLIGTSAGSCIIARLYEKHPGRIKKVGFISPAIDIGEKYGWTYSAANWLLKTFSDSNYLKGRVRKRLIERTRKVLQECPQNSRDFILPILEAEQKTSGYSDGFFRKIIGGVFSDCTSHFTKLVNSEVPIFAVSGKNDVLADFKLFQRTFKLSSTDKDFYGEFNAGHGLQCKDFESISKELIKFIKN